MRRLIVQHGRDGKLTDGKEGIGRRLPATDQRQLCDQCGAHFPDLTRVSFIGAIQMKLKIAAIALVVGMLSIFSTASIAAAKIETAKIERAKVERAKIEVPKQGTRPLKR